MARGDQKRPRSYRPVAHYYGDLARGFLVAAAIAILITVPFVVGITAYSAALYAVLVAVLVISAGITNPHSRAVLVVDALVSALCLVVFTLEAVGEYESGRIFLTVAHTFTATFSLFALYFSVKSVRAMAMHMVGKSPRVGEFDA